MPFWTDENLISTVTLHAPFNWQLVSGSGRYPTLVIGAAVAGPYVGTALGAGFVGVGDAFGGDWLGVGDPVVAVPPFGCPPRVASKIPPPIARRSRIATAMIAGLAQDGS